MYGSGVSRRSKGYRIRYRKDGGWEMAGRLTWVEDRAIAARVRPRAMHPVLARAFPRVATRVFLARSLPVVLLLGPGLPCKPVAWEEPEDDRPPVVPLDSLVASAPNAPGILA